MNNHTLELLFVGIACFFLGVGLTTMWLAPMIFNLQRYGSIRRPHPHR